MHDRTFPDLESNVRALNMGSEPKGHVLISVKTDKQVVDDDLDFDGLLCSLHAVCCNYSLLRLQYLHTAVYVICTMRISGRAKWIVYVYKSPRSS